MNTILHLIASNFYGGPEKQIVEHLIRLNDLRYRKALASFLERKRENEILIKAKSVGLNCYAIPMGGPVDIRALWKLCDILRSEKVDLLCTHGYKSTVMGWLAGSRNRISVLAFSRGYTSENLKVTFYEALERRVLGHVTGIISVSEGQRRRLEYFGIKGRKSWVVSNAVSVNGMIDKQENNLRELIYKRMGIPQGAMMVVTAGRLSPEKGHQFLVEAIAKLGTKTNGVYFVFCGDGPCQMDLEEQARKLGVSSLCRFAGFRRDLGDIFRAMDLMVLPSLSEGLPNVVLEAFACAKPVVATAVGGVPEIVEDGINGLLVPPGRSDVLSAAISKCLAEPGLRRTMGEAGYDKVKTEFTFESQTLKLEKIYEEILKGRDQ